MTVPVDLKPASEVMKVKHLMSETSGIGYEQWTDYQMFDGQIIALLDFTDTGTKLTPLTQAHLSACIMARPLL